MAKELNALAVRGKLGEILEKVFYNGEEYVIKRGNKPMAALIPVEAFEAFKRQRALDMAALNKVREKTKGYSPEEVERDVKKAILAIRKN
ncbi:MAG: type II toxin-antitoxin system Phd/YefM family antitoxin [Syntrophorhabdales bacterium]|jgi:antitoxin (DNA-binding transcriptional repressor) of toxin-antitoxin stability system